MFEVGKKYRNNPLNEVFTCLAIHKNRGWLKRGTNPPLTYTWISSNWSECKEPIKVSGWVNIYPDGSCDLMQNTKKDAHDIRGPNGVTIYISGEEGKEP